MWPPFDLQGGLPLALARAAAVAGLLFVFGSLVFRAVVMPRVLAGTTEDVRRPITRRLLRQMQAGVAAALAGMLLWAVVQSWQISGAASLRGVLAALPVVATRTAFGHLAMLQLAALAGVSAALGGRPDNPARRSAALAFAGIALALQAGHGHAASMEPGISLLLIWDLLHLAASGAWLGGLLPLLSVVRLAPARTGATASRWFSPLGQLCVAALAVSAVGQSWVMVGSLAGFVGTAYGWLLLLKMAGLAALLAFAAANRYRLAPALLHADPAPARRSLVRSIALQSGCGLAVVIAAAVLSNLPPAMHSQTLWPFSYRFTLDTVREDADFRREALGAVLALAGSGVLLVLAALLRRRISLVLAAAAVIIGGFAVPHLDLLFVPAEPTFYYHSPTGFAASSVVRGAALYPTYCASCHGAQGHGDGVVARALPVPPADLTAAHLWMHSDGELFWWLTHGIAAPDGRPAMPGFAAALSDDDRWALIDFIRARNAGTAFQRTMAWPVPLQAPAVQARCDGRDVTLADLRGGFVRLVVGSGTPVAGVTTVLLDAPPSVAPRQGLCVADDTNAASAYAIVAGLPPGQVMGAQFLIDAAGWLRAVQVGGATGWNDPTVLASLIRQLRSQPVASGTMKMDMKMDMKM